MLYIALALAGLVPAAWVICRLRSPALVATAIVSATFVHTADWVASGALGLYKFHPGLASGRELDDALGVVLAELIFVPALAVLLVSLVPAWWGALLGTAIVTVLEFWFMKVGALAAHGWKLWHTAAGFFVYFVLVRQYWLWARNRATLGDWPTVIERAALALLFDGLFGIILWATKGVTSSITILSNPDANQALLRLLWHLGLFAPLCYWVLAGAGLTRPKRLAVALVISVTATQILVATDVRTLSPPWNSLLHGVLQISFFAMAGLVDDRLRNYA